MKRTGRFFISLVYSGQVWELLEVEPGDEQAANRLYWEAWFCTLGVSPRGHRWSEVRELTVEEDTHYRLTGKLP
jgi:hypothetical protein